ncbi:MAG: hypothetical protein PHI31_15125 [Desulfuromonadaceae bacterium]|nr:hypothetical protein [Desulfuromonadaceae bacterium]
MRKTCAVLIVGTFLAISTLSGCILAVEDDGYGYGASHERDHGDRGDRRGGNHGDRR